MFQHQFHDHFRKRLARHIFKGGGGHEFGHGFERHGFGRMHGRHGFGARPNVKHEILSVLADGPRHGYDIILAIEERRGGMRPSPGSIYPALQMLEDGEFIKGDESEGKRVYSILDKGREYLTQHRDRDDGEFDEERDAFRESMINGARSLHGLKGAIKQIMLSHDPEVIRRALEIVDRTRRELYSLLAEGPAPSE